MDHQTQPYEGVPESIHVADEGAGKSIDHWALLWQRKWLLLLGLAAGLGAGFLKYTKDPAIFRSSARIQVVEPYARNIPVEGIDPRGGVSRSLYDETMVIRSEKVLTEAAILGDLTHDELFSGQQPQVIGARLIGGVSINPVGGGMDTSILEISYSCGNPGSARNVVQAVIDAYAEHLRSQHDTVGKETRQLIADVKGEVTKKLEDLERSYDEFKKTSPLIYRGGERTSAHRENAEKFREEKQKLLIRQAQLDSKLRATQEAIDEKEEWPAILLMLQETSNAVSELTENRSPLYSMDNPEIRMSRADIEREQTLLPLQLREQELLNQYGAGHPLVKDIQSQIAITKGLIEEIEKNERQLKEEAAKARKRTLDLLEAQGEGDEIANQVKLYILAMEQQQKALNQEMQVIEKQYQIELSQAKKESAAEIRSAGFERDIARQQGLYDKIVARFDELDVMKEAEGLKVITLEQPKYGYQTAPSLSRSLGMGGTVGFLFVLGLAYLIEWANRAYRSAEEIAEHLRLPVLGHIPITPGDSSTRKAKQALNSKLSPVLCSFFRNKSVHSEAYRAIRTALFFSNQGRGQQVLQVTSAVPADGKTTIACNIAISMAQMGKKVLLVDADMRRPQVDKLFGLDDDESLVGLSWLLEQVPAEHEVPGEMLDKAIQETEVANLSLIPAGDRPDNPAELLASTRFDQVVDSLRDRYDIIIIDSPPLLAVTDPSNIAPRVDGVMLVIRLRKDARPLAAQASRMLETLDAKVIGVVINGVGSREAGEYGKYVRRDGYMNSGRYYQYGYGYTYGYSYGGDRYGDYYRAGRKKPPAQVEAPQSIQAPPDPPVDGA